MFKYFSGIDEAALGPILGPYCCALTTFKIQNEVELFDLFAQLKEIKICDSKKLYTSGKTIEALENTALTFSSYYLKKQPETLLDLLSSLLICKKDINGILNIPWFNRLASLKLP
ncbi:MAG: hypothetical protein PF518_09535, partial [Spirochaetaceae bacterium]|nr:hypothetical protein [Spirochaetaceae bacterium]